MRILRKRPFRVCFIRSHSPTGIGPITRPGSGVSRGRSRKHTTDPNIGAVCKVIGQVVFIPPCIPRIYRVVRSVRYLPRRYSPTGSRMPRLNTNHKPGDSAPTRSPTTLPTRLREEAIICLFLYEYIILLLFSHAPRSYPAQYGVFPRRLAIQLSGSLSRE